MRCVLCECELNEEVDKISCKGSGGVETVAKHEKQYCLEAERWHIPKWILCFYGFVFCEVVFVFFCVSVRSCRRPVEIFVSSTTDLATVSPCIGAGFSKAR